MVDIQSAAVIMPSHCESYPVYWINGLCQAAADVEIGCCYHYLSFFSAQKRIPLLPSQTTTTVLRPFFRDHPGEPVPEENFWTLWCKGRLTEADTSTIRLGTTSSGLTSAHLHHPPKEGGNLNPSRHCSRGVQPMPRLYIAVVVVINAAASCEI